ncbi:hypothetical protein [Roseovarius sp.]
MSELGHNERSYRLDVLAGEARKGLESVERGEEFTIGGWLAYGHALNEGRALFPGDREFGQWVDANVHSQLERAPSYDDRAAAMWAAANADQFDEARQRGNPRTIRGIHAKWKEIQAEREREAFEAEQRANAEARMAAAQHEYMRDEYPEPVSGSKPDQETPPAIQAEPEAQPAPSRAEAPVASEGAGDQDVAQQPAPDLYGYARLTEEALLETANGLRADLDEVKAKLKASQAALKAERAKLADLTADDKTEVIRRLQAQVKNEGNAKWKALEDRDAYHRQVHALKKRVAELEGMGVAI